MDLSFVLRALAARWKGVLLILVIGVGATVGFTLQQPKVYEANADGFVKTVTAANAPEASINDSLAKSRAPSYVSIATSRDTAQRAADALGLNVDPASLIGNIRVELQEGTVLLRIYARSTSPELAQDLADAWVHALADQVEEVEAPGAKTSPVIVDPIQSASLPSSPVAPNVRNNIAIGGLLSLMLAATYALVLARLDRRIRHASEVEQFKASVMGSIPAFSNESRSRSIVLESALEASAGWGASEAFRRLRTNVAYMDVDNPPRVILVTSPNQAEGKSTVAMNLAAAIAASGQDVVLVDADLRRPTAASSLGLDDAIGLTTVLIGQLEVEDAVQRHPTYDRLSVLAAGSVPPNPSELLASNTMGSLIRDLALKRIVVIDAPPVLPVADASVLARHADGALVVIHYGRTVDTELEHTLRQIQSVQGRVLGVVLNRVPRAGGAYYYRRYYTSQSEDGTKRGFRRDKRSRGGRRRG